MTALAVWEVVRVVEAAVMVTRAVMVVELVLLVEVQGVPLQLGAGNL